MSTAVNLELSPMENMPAELAEKFIDHLSLQEKLILRQVSRRLNAMVKPRTPALIEPDDVRLDKLKLTQMKGLTHLCSRGVSLPMAQHFVPLSRHALQTWKRWNGPDKVDCSFTFAYPPADRNFSLFSTAAIKHLKISKDLPLYFESGSVRWLQQLLAGCSVAKVTLVFDHQTLPNLHDVPAFLRSLSCTCVEFVLEKSLHYDMVTPFAHAGLAAALVAAGVETVAFVGLPAWTNGRPQPQEHQPTKLAGWTCNETELVAEDIIFSLYSAGIRTIDVGRYSMAKERGEMTESMLNELIDKLTRLARPRQLRFHLGGRIRHSSLPAGRYQRRYDEEHRRYVTVEFGNYDWGQRITIEFAAEE